VVESHKETSCCQNHGVQTRPNPVDCVAELFLQQRRFNAQAIAVAHNEWTTHITGHATNHSQLGWMSSRACSGKLGLLFLLYVIVHWAYTCVWHVKLFDPSLTSAIPERFRNEYRTHFMALYKWPVYFTYLHYFTRWSILIATVCNVCSITTIRWSYSSVQEAPDTLNCLEIMTSCTFDIILLTYLLTYGCLKSSEKILTGVWKTVLFIYFVVLLLCSSTDLWWIDFQFKNSYLRCGGRHRRPKRAGI